MGLFNPFAEKDTKRRAEDDLTNAGKRLQVANPTTDSVESVAGHFTAPQADAQHNDIHKMPVGNEQGQTLHFLKPEVRRLHQDRIITSKEAYYIVDGEFGACEPAEIDQLSGRGYREARHIFYMDNSFILEIAGYNIRPVKKWLDRVREFRANQKCLGTVTMAVDGKPHWSNLVHWLELSHKRDVIGLDASCADEDAKVMAVKGVFDQVNLLRDCDWATVEKMLPGVRKTLGATDAGWLVDVQDVGHEPDDDETDGIQQRSGKLRNHDVQADEATIVNHVELGAEGTQSQYYTAQEDQVAVNEADSNGNSDEVQAEQEVLDQGDLQSDFESQTLRDDADTHDGSDRAGSIAPKVPQAPRKRAKKNTFLLGRGSPLLSPSQDGDSLDPAHGAGCNQASAEAGLAHHETADDKMALPFTPISLGSTSSLNSPQETMSDIPTESVRDHSPDRMSTKTPSPPDSISTAPPARTVKFETPANSLLSSIPSTSAPPRAPRKLLKQHSIPRACHSCTAKEKPISYVNDIPEQDREVVGKLSKVQRKRL
ncbi:hypothetical protein LTS10_007952 [Elasticomyces elasticus]|nr:hypothetical protein LTS10_007952 [Elasticomyces elasticus]